MYRRDRDLLQSLIPTICSNFLTEAPGQYTGGMQMQGQGQMMQVQSSWWLWWQWWNGWWWIVMIRITTMTTTSEGLLWCSRINIAGGQKWLKGVLWWRFAGSDDGCPGHAGYGETRSVEMLAFPSFNHLLLLCVPPTPHILNLVQCAVGLVLSFSTTFSFGVFRYSRVCPVKSWSLSPNTKHTGAGLIRSYLGAPMQQGGQMQVPGVQMQGMQPGMMGQQQGPRSSE